MIINDLFKNIEKGGIREFLSFETFILNLLKFHILSSGKPFLVIEKMGFDAYAEKGFDDFIGGTAIEVKYNLNKVGLKFILRKYAESIISYEKGHSILNLLIINYNPTNYEIENKFKDQIKILLPNINVVFWSYDDLNNLIQQHEAEANRIINNLFSLRLEQKVKLEKDDWTNIRDQIIDSLKECYNLGRFSLFLGAGVSQSAGMPDWNTLINSLLVSYLNNKFKSEFKISGEDIKQIVSRLIAIDGASALMEARYLRIGMSTIAEDSKNFTTVVSENLYKLRDLNKPLDSDLIVEISNLCMPTRLGAKVRNIITYNFDDLLERALTSKSIKYRSIYTDIDSSDIDELPVYHVHGFLPETNSNYNQLENSTFVFSEEGYHQIYKDPYHWSNLIQLSNLKENNCLMIGLSLTDPNLRRLLDISTKYCGSSKHFVFMKRLSQNEFVYGSERTGNNEALVANITGAEKFLITHHNLQELLMQELGVSIIWIESFDEIPKILKKISTSG